MKISILEHQKIYISSSSNNNNKDRTIFKRDADFLKKLEEKEGKQIFKWGKNTVTPQHWVGVISTPNFDIEILPKITDKETDIQQIREVLIYMLKICLDIPVRKNIDANLFLGRNDGFLDVLVATFLRVLEKEIKKGLLKEYKKTTKNIEQVKGNIKFSKQINKNIIFQNKFVCRFSRLTEDVYLNQIFKYTLILLQLLPISQRNKNLIKKLLPYFGHVEFIKIREQDIEQIVYDRNSERYKELINYCKLFLKKEVVKLKSGEFILDFMLFDMNKLFEKFIYRMLKFRYSNSIKYQHAKQHLLKSMNGNKKKILLKPDIFYTSEDGNVVIDTKWKQIKGFASESDVYQMHSYLNGLDQVKEVILLYPKSKFNDKIVGDYLFQVQMENRLLKIRTIDLLCAKDSTYLDQDLARILGR